MSAVLLLAVLLPTALCDTTGCKRFCGMRQYLVKSPVEGQYGTCQECPDGKYMDKDPHREESCKTCLELDRDSPHYIILKNCSKDHNTEFKCSKGFYRDLHFREDPCQPCTNCSWMGLATVRNCSATTNAACCPRGQGLKGGRCVDASQEETGGTVSPPAPESTDTPCVGDACRNGTLDTDTERSGGNREASYVVVLKFVIVPVAIIILLILLALILYCCYRTNAARCVKRQVQALYRCIRDRCSNASSSEEETPDRTGGPPERETML